MTYEIICAGFGGQGVLFMGKMLAYAGMLEGREVSWIPSYGPEMRGGTCNCSVVVSDRKVGTPVVSTPNVLIALNRPSQEKFESRMQKDGLMLVNKTLIEIDPARSDIDVCNAELTKIASDLGNVKLANVVALGALIARRPIVKKESVIQALRGELTGKKEALLEVNLKALDAGIAAAGG